MPPWRHALWALNKFHSGPAKLGAGPISSRIRRRVRGRRPRPRALLGIFTRTRRAGRYRTRREHPDASPRRAGFPLGTRRGRESEDARRGDEPSF